MSAKTLEGIKILLAAALEETSKAKTYVAEDNPYADRNLSQMRHGAGILKSADKHPALNKAPAGGLGYEMEAERLAGEAEGKADLSQRRKAAALARAQRKAQIDEIANSPVIPSGERMTEAWAVVFPLVPIITRIADGKKAWAVRFLGSSVDDITQMTLEKTALVLAKSDRDLGILQVAASELGMSAERSGRIPGDQLTDEVRKHRKAIGKARKWLMGLVNNRVMGALVDSYTDQRNLRWDNIDLISTVMASISGVGEDPLVAHTKANRAPSMLGTRYQRPGGIDGNLLAQAISAAISDRKLDGVVELILDDDNRRTDGAFKWTELAETIFRAGPDGEWMWTAVQKATEHLESPRRAQAEAARKYVRRLFDWLPGFVVSVIDSFDPQRVAYGPCGRAIMAAGFDGYLETPHIDGLKRFPLRPALTFASPTEAAEALTKHLNILISGQDLASSVAYA